MEKKSLNIWVDIANSPHVLFFEPIISELKKLGHNVHLTVRDFCNTVPLAEDKGFEFEQIGTGFEFARIESIKRMYLYSRRAKLIRYAQSKNFDVAVSHGSSSQAMAAKKLGIPVFSTQDYEYNNLKAFGEVECFMIPDIAPAHLFESGGVLGKAILRYSGLKENVYLYNYNFKFNDVIDKFKICPDEMIVTFRPVSDTAHYLDYSNRDFQNLLIEKMANQRNVKIIVIPRTEYQRNRFDSKALRFPNIKVCHDVVDGPSLIALSDLVVSGGGTMIREAAVLGIPAVSFFHGKMGAVDLWLEKEGKLLIIRDEGDLKRILPLKKRLNQILKPGNGTISSIVTNICKTALWKT